MVLGPYPLVGLAEGLAQSPLRIEEPIAVETLCAWPEFDRQLLELSLP